MPARRRPTSRWPRWSGSTPRRSAALVEHNGVKLAAFPPDMVDAARKTAREVMGEIRHA